MDHQTAISCTCTCIARHDHDALDPGILKTIKKCFFNAIDCGLKKKQIRETLERHLNSRDIATQLCCTLELNAYSLSSSTSSSASNLEDLVLLGFIYEKGFSNHWFKKNEEFAYQKYRESADAGNSYGQYFVGVCFKKGIGIKIDWRMAYEFFEVSARQRNPAACYKLGSGYDRVQVPEQKKNCRLKAFLLYIEAANAGHVMAKILTGLCYEMNWGTERDIHQAIRWLLKANNDQPSIVNNALLRIFRPHDPLIY
ncbi:2612_t:CDS:1 [Ambispora leptoticha]|uniref:2612_t:CDS:1 n=1 Tax=Ambispora leptoticha TaxID=144679 RepID=A0A9N8ZQ07_9GLOM|nr:2612_t:CDS:1 [Ambispora leptoticha]